MFLYLCRAELSSGQSAQLIFSLIGVYRASKRLQEEQQRNARGEEAHNQLVERCRTRAQADGEMFELLEQSQSWRRTAIGGLDVANALVRFEYLKIHAVVRLAFSPNVMFCFAC